MFIDEAKIHVRSGRGGDGMVHFHREKFVNRGGPDGGDGGHGGHVILQVVPTINTLVAFRHQTKYLAKPGEKGGVSDRTGKSAPDLIIPVPPGTIVYDDATGELMGDLLEAGQLLKVCKGGRGGKGNPHFMNSRNQAPFTAEKGEPEEERWLRLELKLIADVGLVGLPNAGKSSLLAAVTNAKPKIADYPFTTLEPNLGVVELDLNSSFVIADIPGLIEGAHMGVGLGDAFLRHVQRTKVLIHMLDGSAEDPLADYTQINNEMALFDPGLGRKSQLVVINKIDKPEVQERLPKLTAAFKKKGIEISAISALTKKELDPLLWKAFDLIKSYVPEEEPVMMPVYQPPEDLNEFQIVQVPEGWRVTGKAIERAAEMTYWEHPGSVRRFQHLMERIGLEQALRDAGVVEGETVFIRDFELEWQD
ncbi:MAG: GTPase ObgE [Anaerolineaceae bacterium]